MKAPIGYILSSVLALLISCQHSQDPTTGTTQVSGQVVESQSRLPLPYATVQVWHASSAQGYLPVGSTYASDAHGKFRANS
jgi:hypothetical protein